MAFGSKRRLVTLSQGVGWWPAGAVAAADFNANRYMLNGVVVPFSTLFDSPASPNLVTRNGRQALQIVATKYQFNDLLKTAISSSATVVLEGDTVQANQGRLIGGTNPVSIIARANNNRTFSAYNGTNNLGLTCTDQLGFGTRFKIAAAYSGSPSRKLCLNGMIVQSDANSIGTLDHIWLGSDSSTNFATGWYDKVTWYAGVLTDAQMRALTVSADEIAFFGDSLTSGTGSTSAATALYGAVGNSFATPRIGQNIGVGGATSTDILGYVNARPEFWGQPVVIWAGRNNFSSGTQVKADIAAMVAKLTTSKYAVLSIINASGEANPSTGYNQITQLNSDLAALYGAHFLDVRGPLVAGGAPAGAVPDPTAYAGDYPPAGYVNGSPHLNDAGYAVVAGVVYAYAVSAGW